MRSFSALVAAIALQTSLALPTVDGNPRPSTSSYNCKIIRRQYGDTGDSATDDHEWIPAANVANAVRAPCPFLNTAANHGFLPRDGRQVSIAQFDSAIEQSLGFSETFAHTITTGMLTKLGVLTNTSQDASLRIDLDQTNAHDKTEHDASLSRLDASQGDAATVQPKLVQAMLDDTVPKTFGYLNTSSIGQTRIRRQRESVELGNPPLSDTFVTASQGEAGLILLIMGDGDAVTPENGDSRQAPKNRVQTWIDEERFPYELGFKVPSRVVQAAELVPLREGIAKFQAGGSPSKPTPLDDNGYSRVINDHPN